MNEQYYYTDDIEREIKYSRDNRNARPDNFGLAIASMILGIISLVFFLFGLNFFTAIVSIILGIIFLVSNARAGKIKGRGMAITGIITSVLSITFFIGSIVFIMGNAEHIVEMFESELESNPGFYQEFEYNYNNGNDFNDFNDNNLDFDIDIDDTL